MSMNNTLMMSPGLLALYTQFQTTMLKANIPYMLTCVARTPEMQKALYAQGREDLATVNALRLAVGQAAITDAQNHKVTWTMSSKHVIDPTSTDPDQRLSHAFDIAVTQHGNPNWDLGLVLPGDPKPAYQRAAEIGKLVGLNPGYFWNTKDPCHYQIGV